MQVTKRDEEDIWISAVRYGLGRKTYITSVISDFMQSKVHDMSPRCREVMRRDIKQCADYGHECDKKVWMKLLNKLNKYVGIK